MFRGQGEGRDSKTLLRDFAVKFLAHPKGAALPQKTKSWLARCRKLATRFHRGELRGKFNRRRLTGGGRSPAAELEYALFHWYVDMMGATTTRIWPKTLRSAANVIVGKITRIHERQGKPPPFFPKITVKWIWSFMKKFKIVWRKATVRYKVSRAKMLRRSKRTWRQSAKVRYGLQLLHGEKRRKRGLRVQVHSHIVDQKPIHENEGESAGRGTLSWSGMPAVHLKTDVSASRNRVSLNNHGSDDPFFEAPVEACFKLKTDRCLRALRLPDNVQMSVRNSESGSYDEEAFLAYLDRWIPLWTPEREANSDYRIMYLDDYSVHNMESVRRLLWERGFFRCRTADTT